MKRNKIIGIILFIFIIIGGVVGCSNNSKETVGKSIAQNEKGHSNKRKIRTDGNDSPILEAKLEVKEESGDKERFDSYVYSVEKLKENYNNVIVLDARPQKEYDKGHLPNAVRAHWKDWSNTKPKQNSGEWGLLYDNQKLSELFGKLGIDGTKPVVIYNDTLNGRGEEGRQLWGLRVFGLNNTYILNGGIKAWTESGGELTKGTSNIKPVKGPPPKPNLELIATTEDIAKNLGNINVLDVREDEEYAGTKNHGEASKGRIPNSKHIWFKDLYNKEGKLLTPAEIRSKVEAKGFKTSDKVTAYCTSGTRSGFASIALQVAGYNKACNYNGSFSAWAGTGQEIDKNILKELDN